MRLYLTDHVRTDKIDVDTYTEAEDLLFPEGEVADVFPQHTLAYLYFRGALIQAWSRRRGGRWCAILDEYADRIPKEAYELRDKRTPERLAKIKELGGRVLTSEEVRAKYKRDLDTLASVSNLMLRRYWNACEIVWETENSGHVLVPEQPFVTEKVLAFFCFPDTVWTSPTVRVTKGRIAISIILIDYFIEEQE